MIQKPPAAVPAEAAAAPAACTAAAAAGTGTGSGSGGGGTGQSVDESKEFTWWTITTMLLICREFGLIRRKQAVVGSL